MILFFGLFGFALTLNIEIINNSSLFAPFFAIWFYITKKLSNSINSDKNGVIYYQWGTSVASLCDGRKVPSRTLLWGTHVPSRTLLWGTQVPSRTLLWGTQVPSRTLLYWQRPKGLSNLLVGNQWFPHVPSFIGKDLVTLQTISVII